MTDMTPLEQGARARYERFIRNRPHFVTWDGLGSDGQSDECQAFAAGLEALMDMDDSLIELGSETIQEASSFGKSPWSAFVDTWNVIIRSIISSGGENG